MQARKTLLALAMIFSLVATASAQDTDKKKKRKKDGKNQLERITKRTTNQLMKAFKAAEMTDEQKEKATGIVKKYAEQLMMARKAQDKMLTAEQRKARKQATAKAKKDGMRGKKMYAAGFKAMNMSEEDLKKFGEAKKKVDGLMKKMRAEIVGVLSSEQQAAVKNSKGKRGGKKGKGRKGKKGKKKDIDSPANSLQTVSLNLPGMTCGGCANAIQTALKSVDGVSEIATDVEKKNCTFKAPANLNVNSTITALAKDVHQFKDWKKND